MYGRENRLYLTLSLSETSTSSTLFGHNKIYIASYNALLKKCTPINYIHLDIRLIQAQHVLPQSMWKENGLMLHDLPVLTLEACWKSLKELHLLSISAGIGFMQT